MEEKIPSPSQTQTTALQEIKKPSLKQLEHLAKAREAKKRKAEDSLENILIDLRDFVKEQRIIKNQDKSVIENTPPPQNQPPEIKKQRLYDNLISLEPTYILPAVAVLAMFTLGTIGVSRHYLSQDNMYSYL